MSTSLWITLEGRTVQDSTNRQFVPGETIVGHVHRAAQLVTPEAGVYIRLHGRSKSKLIVQKGPNNHSFYRGRFELIDDRATVMRLFQGPVHIPPGAGAVSWPFTLTIPTHVSVNAVCAEAVRMKTFIPVDPAEVKQHELPPTMSALEKGYNTTVQGFVEYFLQADFSMTIGGRKEVIGATLPIIITRVSQQPPVRDFKLKQCPHPCEVQTQLLLPGRHNDKLSVKEKFKKSMGTPSVPILSVQFQVKVPTILQIGNPMTIPFVVQLVPNWEKTSKVIRKEPQKVKLILAELKVETTTLINCEGTYSDKNEDSRTETDLGVWGKCKSLGREIDLGQEGSWPAVDIGALVDLRLSPDSSPAVADPDTMLNCSYTTYNVQQKHALVWKIHLDIAGEPVNAAGREMVTILPASSGPADRLLEPGLSAASETWIQPPPPETDAEAEAEAQLGEALPSFAQVQKQDMMAAKP